MTRDLHENSVYRIQRTIDDCLIEFISTKSVKIPRFLGLSNTNSRGDLGNSSQKTAGVLSFLPTLTQYWRPFPLSQVSYIWHSLRVDQSQQDDQKIYL